MSTWIEKNRNRKIESNRGRRSYSQLPNKQDSLLIVFWKSAKLFKWGHANKRAGWSKCVYWDKSKQTSCNLPLVAVHHFCLTKGFQKTLVVLYLNEIWNKRSGLFWTFMFWSRKSGEVQSSQNHTNKTRLNSFGKPIDFCCLGWRQAGNDGQIRLRFY